MPEAKIVPFDTDGTIIRYDRDTWLQASVDDWTLPPAQNPDAFLQLTNILPPATGVLLRRFGYRFFNPALDNGASIDSDEVMGGPVPVVATPLFNYAITTISGGSVNTITINFQPTYGNWIGNFNYSAGTSIVDSNGNVERVVVGGLSNNVGAPIWPTSPVGTLTHDGAVTWEFVKYAISVGDTILMPMIFNGATAPSIVTLTDSSGDTWGVVAPNQTFNTTNTFTTWATRSIANIAYGTPLAITILFNQTLFSGDTFNTVLWSNLGVRTLPTVQGQGSGATAWSSGSLSVPANTILFSTSVSSAGENPVSPWVQNGPLLAYYIPGTGGTFADSWVSTGGPANWASSLFAYPFMPI